MEDRKMEIIQQLMEELQGMMEPDENDLSERLGRKKPDLEVVKVEGSLDPAAEEGEMDLEDEEMIESPEDKLKSRLMKLRGA